MRWKKTRRVTSQAIKFLAASRLLALLLCLHGCATLFGWDIHAPGVLSQHFVETVPKSSQRIGLYLDSSLGAFQSTDRGSALSDPQTYHIGESLHPMLIEAFQQAFEEFILLEVESNPGILKQYAIPYVVTIRVHGFNNTKGRPLSRQVLTLFTKVELYDSNLTPLQRFEAKGRSDTRKVFAKRGGPEVNLNAAIENNVLATIQFLQDVMK